MSENQPVLFRERLDEVPDSPKEYHRRKYLEKGVLPAYYSPEEQAQRLQHIDRRLTTLLQALRTQSFPIEGLILVGSLVHGNMHPESDVDYISLSRGADLDTFDQMDQYIQTVTHLPAQFISDIDLTHFEQGLEGSDTMMIDGYRVIHHKERERKNLEKRIKKWLARMSG